MKIKFGLILALIAARAIAADCPATLTWTAPTQNTDGSTLSKCATQTSTPTPACLRGYNVYTALTAAGIASGTRIQINDRNALTYTHTVTNCTSHTQYYAVSAYDSAGAESALSSVGSKAFNIPTIPNAPGSFTVQPDVAGANTGTAYRMRQGVDSFEFVAMGKAPITTVCDMSKATVDGYALIPRASVKLASSVDTLPLMAFAKCSAG